MAKYIDPFGAPEFVVTGVAFRELIGSEFIKLGWCEREGGKCILRFKAIIPVKAIVYEHGVTKAFLRAHLARTENGPGGVLM